MGTIGLCCIVFTFTVQVLGMVASLVALLYSAELAFIIWVSTFGIGLFLSAVTGIVAIIEAT